MDNRRYIISNDNSEVLDIKTNLIWSYEIVTSLTYPKAILYSKYFSLHTELNWRLPTFMELFSSLDYLNNRYKNSLNKKGNSYFWSATLTYHIEDEAYCVDALNLSKGAATMVSDISITRLNLLLIRDNE